MGKQLCDNKNQNKSLGSHVMKCDKEMAELLFDAQKRFDSLHLKGKCKQKLKRCMTKLSCHETHDSCIKQILIPTKKHIK